MKLKYVGTKDDGETAFAFLTKIPVWMPGDANEIADPDLVNRMLQHPDVWQPAGEGPSTVLAPVVARQVAASTPAAALPTGAGPSLALVPGAVIGAVLDAPKTDGPSDETLIIVTPDGPVTLDGLDKDQLRLLADRLGVAYHHAAGVPRLTALLVEAFPPAADKADEEQGSETPQTPPASDSEQA